LFTDRDHLPSSQFFFEELSSLLDIMASLKEAVFVVGDFNMHLERSDDPATKQFIDLLCHYGFSHRPTAATHGAGGTLDAVIACDATDSGQCVDSQLSSTLVYMITTFYLDRFPVAGRHQRLKPHVVITGASWMLINCASSSEHRLFANLTCDRVIWMTWLLCMNLSSVLC